jgi:hypothetical protein
MKEAAVVLGAVVGLAVAAKSKLFVAAAIAVLGFSSQAFAQSSSTATSMSAFWQFAVRSRICRDRQTWRIEDETSIAKKKLMALVVCIKKRFSARGVL